jgi:hypothetical protein
MTDLFVVVDKIEAEPYPHPQQDGPLRWFDREMRCANRGCSSSTYIKVQGIPRCMMHSLSELNNLLIGKGVKS